MTWAGARCTPTGWSGPAGWPSSSATLAADECLIYDSRPSPVDRAPGLRRRERPLGRLRARRAMVCRVIGRFAVGVPVANKGIRKLTIEGAAPAPLPAPAMPAAATSAAPAPRPAR